MRIDLNKPVSVIPKIGPRSQFLLKNLEIETVENLLYHFPFRYDDFSVVKKISELLEGETATVQAKLLRVDNIYTKTGKRLTKAIIEDISGTLDIFWFNQQYIKSILNTGEIYNFSGRIGLFSKKMCLVGPDFELFGVKNINTGRLVPVYPETAGISSKWLRSRINDVLGMNSKFEDFLPKELLIKNKLENFDSALRNFHFPQDLAQVAASKKRFAFEELFLELIKVANRKNQWQKEIKANPIKAKKDLEKFISSLPFTLTQTQQDALTDILENLGQTNPMNRLLEGDVGTGKTIVAIIASYLTFLNGYKVLYMAPTEILANQHYQTYKTYLENLGVKIVLSTSQSKLEKDFDIAIGTHALLEAEEKFKKIGLVVIDEQHRFGVEQRTKIINLGHTLKKPHVLSMTATPIPRTLALTIYGDLAISHLKTSPNKDKKITTRVIKESQREKAYEWIKKTGEPAFIVCPLIDESTAESFENVKAAQNEYVSLKNGVFKSLTVGLLHGKMKSKEKDEVIKKFKAGTLQILVSTPVIEVGMDIPEASIMVIESAERYGLASLHQLRGRVGRGNKPGFCLIFMSNSSRSGYARLKNLETVDSGLELAEIDMKLRGEGDIFGLAQHGIKRFRLADLTDILFLEKVKRVAEETFPELDKYPLLKDKLNERYGEMVESN